MELRLKKLLAARQKRTIQDGTRVPAAVLVPLYRHGGEYYLVFIKRSKLVKTHKGQISFPGGARDRRDSTLLDTALRESNEEIGLRPGDVEVLGEMDDEITTTSNFIVTPFVARIPWPYEFVRNHHEVREIIHIPVNALLSDECRHPDKEFLEGQSVDSCTYYFRNRVIWGATARILNKFLKIFSEAVQQKGDS